MGIFNPRSPRPPGSSDDPGIFATILAWCLYPLIQSARYLWGRVYGHGFSGYFLASFGGIAAVFGSVAVGHYLRGGLELPAWQWLPVGVVSWAFLFWWGLPSLWLWFLNPVIEMAQAIHDRFRNLLREYAGPFFNGLLRFSTIICPFSGSVWKPLLDETKSEPVVARALQAVFFLSSLAASGYAAWLTFWGLTGLVLPWVGFMFYGSVVAWAVAGAVGIIVFSTLVAFAVGLLEFGKLPFLSIFVSALSVYAGYKYGYIAWLGLGWAWSWVVAAVAFALCNGYLFPGIIRMFANGFWAAVWDAIRPWPSKAYGDDNKVYVHFHHHVWTMISTALMVWGAVTVCGAMSMWLPITIGVAAVTAYSAYGLIFKATDHGGGTFMFSAAVAIPAAYFGGEFYINMAWFGAFWGGIVAGAIILLAVLLLINPGLYLGFRNTLFAVGKLGLAGPVSNGFNRLNTWYLDRQSAMSKLNASVYDLAEQDASGYGKQFLHVSNLFVTYGVWWLVHHYAVGFGSIWAWPAVVGLPLLSYALIGRTFTHSGKGLPLVSSILGLVAATYVGVAVLSLGTTPALVTAAASSALFAALAVVFVLFVPMFVAVRALTKSWTVGWLGPFLATVHEAVWQPFGWFGDRVASALEGLIEAMKPVFARISKALARVRVAYERVLEKIRGRR